MRTSTKICLAMFLSVVLYFTASCRLASNDLMEGASPGTSALSLYHFDGETVTRAYIFDSNIIQQVLDELSSVRVTEVNDWTLKDITLPMFGIRIGTTSGATLRAAWSNGLWITQDGRAYDFNYDFDKLQQSYNWTGRAWFSSFTVFPNARLFTQDNNGWDNRFLSPAPSINTPIGITMTLKSWDDDTASVYITNNTNTEWIYGQLYEIHVLLNNMWYEIPIDKENWAFTSDALVVQAGETIEHNYNLRMYGNLPAGTYRLVAFGLLVENTIP